MPCSIQIRSANGLVPSGQSNPTQLRVTGRGVICPGAQSVTITSSITNPLTVNLPLGGDFVATLPILGTVQCGDLYTVRVECVGSPACADQKQNIPLECCALTIISVRGVVPVGSLDPSQIIVSGTLLGCISNQVVVSSNVTGTSGPTSVDPVTGGFTVQLPVTMPVKCDAKIVVTAECFWATPPSPPTPSCRTQWRDGLDCPQCARAQVSYSAVPCTGTPPTQLVTLNAIICIPAGTTRQFQWDYGDGNQGPILTVNNTGGNGATQHPVSDTHTYSPGTWPAQLRIVPPPYECDEFPLTVTVTCVPNCPTGTIVVADPGECVNGQRTVKLQASVTAPAGTPAFGQWNLGYAPIGGSPLGKAFLVPGGATQNQTTNPNLEETRTYPPGTYTVFLDVGVGNPGCPNPSLTFTVTTCPVTCEVLLDYTPKPLPCLSAGGSLTVNFVATLSPPNPAYNGPFTWEVTQGGVSLKKVTQNAPAVADPRKFSHTFTSPGSYDVTVTIATPGCENPFDTASASPQIVVKTCCPTFVGPLQATQITQCDWSFSAVVDNPNNMPVTFEWKFDHDNTTATTPIPSTTHKFAVGSITTGMVTITMKAQGCPDQKLTTTVTHFCFDATPPTVSSCSVSAGTPGTITVTFSEDVNQASATNAGNFAVTVNGTPRVPTSLSYSPNTTTINGINISPGDTVNVTVTNVADKAGNVIAGNNSTSCSAPGGGGGGGMAVGCWILLIAALVLAVVASILGIMAACTGNPYLGIAAGIIAVVALILLILWLIFCAAGNCGIFNWVRWIVMWIMMIAVVVAIILAIVVSPACGVIAAFILWGYWGMILLILDIAGPKIGCPLTPPPFP